MTKQTTAESSVIDSGVCCLCALVRLHGVAADPDRLRHLAGGTTDAATLVRLARQLMFKARLHRATPARLSCLPLPAIAQMRDGAFVLLLKHNGDGVLLHDPLTLGTTRQETDSFVANWSGQLILAVPRAQAGQDGAKFDISWFLPALAKYRRQLAEVLCGSLFLQLLGLAAPLFMQVVIDKVLVHKSLATLDVIILGTVGVALFEAMLGGLRGYLFSHTTNRVDVELGVRLFRHLMALPLMYFQTRRVGDSVARVRELENIRNFLTGNAITVVIDLSFTLLYLAVMVAYAPLLALLMAALLPLYAALSMAVTPALRARLDDKFQRGAESQAFLVESVTGIDTVKAMAAEPVMLRKWEALLAAYVGSAFRATNLANGASQAAQLLNKLATAALLWLGTRMVIDAQLSVGALIAVTMLASRVSAPVVRLAQLWQDFQQVRLSMRRLADILDTPAEGDAAGGFHIAALRGEIAFDNVSFRYRTDGPDTLRDISFRFPEGSVIGIVGPSGSGKSTLTKLLVRLYCPQRGRVLFDGVDIAGVDPASLRRQIGVVQQDNLLFTGTVRDNITLVSPGASPQQVIAAAKLAGAHEFILELPHGYDSMLGERGTGLSTGQRQRLAIARALLGDPRVLIFDEATSALDAESESIILRNMPAICRGRTVLIIAHRLTAVRGAHCILTMDKGAIHEAGTHDELLRQGGRYAALWRHQSGGLHVA